jgi:hypothetical protein
VSALPLYLFACALYALVALASAVAAAAGVRAGRPRGHLVRWILLAALFAALIAWRLLEIEDSLRDGWRGALKADAIYDRRREFQRPAAALVFLAGAALAAWLGFRTVRQAGGRLDLFAGLASLCGLGMITLVGLRLVSLSPVDKLLYGPLKLNWFADIGGSLAVLGLAAAYVHRARRGVSTAR